MAAANLLDLNGKREMDKAKALESALAQIERQFGKGSIMKLGSDNPVMDIEATSTGSLGLDIALGIGGLPQGRIIEMWGPRRRKKAGFAPLSTPNTRWTRNMPRNLALTLMNC